MPSPLLIALLVAVYYAPMVPAIVRWRRYPEAMHPFQVFLLVTFLGWTVLGWVAAWIFALRAGTHVRAEAGTAPSLPLWSSDHSSTTWAPKPAPVCPTCGGSGYRPCTSCIGQSGYCGTCYGTKRAVCNGGCGGSGKLPV